MHKWGKQYRDFINKEIRLARRTGWPFDIWYEDRYGRRIMEEMEYYRKYRRSVYTKKARLSGEYEFWTGRKDKRFSK